MIHKLILSKPKITLLLTFTGVVAYLIPGLDNITFVDMLVFIVAGLLSSDGALIVNYYVDRDIDILMDRTKNRVSVGENAVAPYKVLSLGIIVTAMGILLSYLYFGIFTAIHMAWGALFYIFGYSIYLKRKSILNTVLGAFASPAPVWAGYAARFEIQGIDGDWLGVPWIGWSLGMLVVIWTPSHTWALSTKNVDDYRNAGIPMVPVRYGLELTAKVTMIGGLITIIYAIIIGYWMTSSILAVLLISLSSILLARGLLVFLNNPSVDTGTLCFKDHNKWLSLVFLILLIFS